MTETPHYRIRDDPHRHCDAAAGGPMAASPVVVSLVGEWLIALLVALAVPAAASGAAPAPAVSEPPVFGTQAEIVTVDVVVLDGKGKSVSGLERSDFVVKEDGKAQTVTAFEEIQARVPTLVAPEPATSPSVSRVATNAAAPPTRRTFAIVFDDLHVGDVNVEEVKRGVDVFVRTRTVPGDKVVLVTVSDGRYWSTTHAANDLAWRDALKHVRSHRLGRDRVECRVSYYEALQIELMNNQRVDQLVKNRLAALCAPPFMRASPEQLAAGGGGGSGGGPSGGSGASQGGGGSAPSSADIGAGAGAPRMPEVYTRERGQLAGTLRVVREIVSRLGATPGRKALVLVSEGFPVDPSLDLFREVREQAARANVAIDFLDARGLATGPDFLSAAGSTGMIPNEDLGLTLALWKMEDGGTKALAEETGGRVLQTNDLVSGLQQVADESRVTYLLGYEPTNEKRDGRYRKLKVEVTRPGLTVRARAGYFAEKGKKKPAPEPSAVDRALQNPFDADGIPLRLAAYVMGPAPLESPVPKTGVEVLIAGEIRLDALETRVVGNRVVAEPRLTLVATSRSGESHQSDWTLEVDLARPAEDAPPAQAWHPFLTRIAMEPGDHRARLVAESGGRIGSVTVDFDVPDVGEERLSTPILSDRLVDRPGGRGVMPVVRREFGKETTLQCWMELQGAAKDGQTGLARAVAAFAARSADGREWASGPAVEMKAEGGRLVRLVSLPLADAPAGESEIVLSVRDDVSGRSFEAREPFRVSGEESPAAATSPVADRQ